MFSPKSILFGFKDFKRNKKYCYVQMTKIRDFENLRKTSNMIKWFCEIWKKTKC